MTDQQHFIRSAEAWHYIKTLDNAIKRKLLIEIFYAFLIQEQNYEKADRDIDMLYVMKTLNHWLNNATWIAQVLNGENPIPEEYF